ncbi:hypothetical protein H257_10745 [Aphanomyces astaci]|uniref:Uncharacterized protein n=1 Tax=Aphanomyces astaci TaxID=112090 RepID=W4G6R5_APHAT|nr:hypothetical protein H257_10745 [Aphanomyces astaci]ETV74608.1 hypothetical protein H257_10745 [Aphanomyces astaci]|eukprot:XP_009835695.1 hypothetical protein H257_10745 [Aphanomyces astaci]
MHSICIVIIVINVIKLTNAGLAARQDVVLKGAAGLVNTVDDHTTQARGVLLVGHGFDSDGLLKCRGRERVVLGAHTSAGSKPLQADTNDAFGTQFWGQEGLAYVDKMVELRQTHAEGIEYDAIAIVAEQTVLEFEEFHVGHKWAYKARCWHSSLCLVIVEKCSRGHTR